MKVKIQRVLAVCLFLMLVTGSPACAAFVEVELDTNHTYLNTSFQYLKVDDLMQLDQTEMSVIQATTGGSEVKTITSPYIRDITREFAPTEGTVSGATITIAEASSIVRIDEAYSSNVFTQLYMPAFEAQIPGKEGVIVVVKCNSSAAREDFTTWDDIFGLQEAMYFFAGETGSDYEGAIYRIDPAGGPVREGVAKTGSLGPYYDSSNLGDTLTNLNNVVSLSDYTTDRGTSFQIPDTTNGKYAVSAMAYFPDNETFSIYGGLPVVIMDSDRGILWNGATESPTFIRNISEDVTLTFEDSAAITNISYALINNDEQYDAIVHVNAENLLDTARAGWENLILSTPAMPQILEDGIRNFDPDGAYTYAIKLTSEDDYPPFATDTTLAITPGYGISGVERYGNSIVIPGEQLNTLVPGNYQLYALGTDAEYDPLALDQMSVLIADRVTEETELSAGWNMVSFNVVNSTPVFPPGYVNSSVYTYNGTSKNYDGVPDDEIVPGIGYWVATQIAGNIISTGMPVTNYTVTLKPGWNMIASLYEPVLISDAVVNPEGSLRLPAYRYDTTDQIYREVDTISPGDGVWLNAKQECTFAISI